MPSGYILYTHDNHTNEKLYLKAGYGPNVLTLDMREATRFTSQRIAWEFLSRIKERFTNHDGFTLLRM